MNVDRIRNFSIIAHIDHGKSTLADRLLETTGTLSSREMEHQFLDNMDLERERGITIKAQAVRLDYTAKDGQQYVLNLIDTPGHVDFSYEVSRSLAACEGALLVVDASQGVEAQTLANVYLALDNNLEIIPVINKIDLPGADPENVREQIEEVIGLDAHERRASRQRQDGHRHRRDPRGRRRATCRRPKGDPDAPLKALIFDSWYDTYRGVVVLVRVIDGIDQARRRRSASWHTGRDYEVERARRLRPRPTPIDELGAGEVGFVIANIKDVADVQGRRHHHRRRAARTESPSRASRRSSRWSSPALFPIDADDYEDLRDALEKLRLNDASFTYEPETSTALGFGFRCGFLGLLHMEIVQERLEREYNLDLITTAPSVSSTRCTTTDGEVIEIDNPPKLPEPVRDRRRSRSPFITRHDPHARRVRRRRSCALLRTPRRPERASSTSATDRVHARPTRCRWPRSSSTSTTG